VPKLAGVGGMVSFQAKLAAGLLRRHYEVCYSLADRPFDAVLVIGGTRNLKGLWQARRSGIPIVQRLDGMNWLHRRRKTGLRHYLRSEAGNLLLALTRARFADRIVYQSHFARQWWQRVYGVEKAPGAVIYNGVDLAVFSPDGPHRRPDQRYQILLVEGSLAGGYEGGVETAVKLGELLHGERQLPVEVVVAGKMSAGLQRHWRERASFPLRFLGVVPHERIPEIDRSAHLLYAADLNAACPNSVIEALACGLPVISFDTGALPELVQGGAGRIAPYGGDPWRLDPPNLEGLAQAALDVLRNQDRFRIAARRRAEDAFSLEGMVDAYLSVLLS